MDNELMKPVAWVRFRSDGCYEGPIMNSDSRMDGVRRTSGAWTPLFTAPPVPRDVLMSFGTAVRDAAKRADFDIGEDVDIASIADRYASKVQPEQPDPLDAVGEVMELRAWRAVLRGLCVGRELLTPDECAENVRHQLRTAKKAAANQPEPVNQQLLAALKDARDIIETISENASSRSDRAYAARTLRTGNHIDSAIAAADAAQPVCQTCKGSGYIGDFLTLAHDCPDCQQPASAQQMAVPDGARKVFICDVCEGVYADEPVTNCDCTVSEKTTFSEGYIVMLSAAQKPEGV